MPIEIVLALTLALVAGGSVAGGMRARRARALVWLLTIGASLVLGSFAVRDWLPSVATHTPGDRPIEVTRGGYVSSGACRACHPRNHATWHRTWHRTMTQVATPDTAIGRFDGKPITVGGRSYRMSTEGGRLWGEFTATRDGERLQRRVPLVMSTGAHHMQVYWYPGGNGRTLDQFPLVWVREAARWLPRNAAFVRPPVDQMPDEHARWNTTCIKCHTTRGRPRLIDLDAFSLTRGVRSEAAEFGIACEACHGPGAEHVAANRNPLRRYRLALGDAPDPTITNPARLSPERSAQICGQCHSVFTARDETSRVQALERGFDFRPGEDLEASRHIIRHGPAAAPADGSRLADEAAALIPLSFWPDGMVRVSGREYNGLTASPCFVPGEHGDGLTCISCHRLHQDREDDRPGAEWADDLLERGMRTNAACLRCHQAFAPAASLEAHTRHPPDSSASLCYNCHMPPTTFGLLKAMRSHTIDSPSARVARDTGRPLACNLCHLDRSLGWSAERLEQWYGQPPVELDGDDANLPASVVALLAGDAGARVLAAWSMGWTPAMEASPGMPRSALLATLLEDPYEAVRYVAARSLGRQHDAPALEYDFLADTSQRAAAAARLRAGTPLDPADPGWLDSRLARLAARRDDRPVLLAE